MLEIFHSIDKMIKKCKCNLIVITFSWNRINCLTFPEMLLLAAKDRRKVSWGWESEIVTMNSINYSILFLYFIFIIFYFYYYYILFFLLLYFYFIYLFYVFYILLFYFIFYFILYFILYFIILFLFSIIIFYFYYSRYLFY